MNRSAQSRARAIAFSPATIASVPSPQCPYPPGLSLGPYEVLALLGAGGMGEVYRARDPRLGREVAIKVLPHDRVADESRRQRFIQEAKAASALNHPHIITIHEIESANGIDFIVMEYVRGKSLDALIPRQGMRLGEVLRIAIPVADALAAAHAQRHRPSRPQARQRDGRRRRRGEGARLRAGEADGHRRRRREERDDHGRGEPGLSAPGAIAGTAAYMSPEQASGGEVDARSDIFSFGRCSTRWPRARGRSAGRPSPIRSPPSFRRSPSRRRETVPGCRANSSA